MRLVRPGVSWTTLISDAQALRRTNSRLRYLSTTNLQQNVYKSPFRDVTWPKCTLPELVWESLDKWPEKIALQCGVNGKTYTYAEMKRSSRRLGVALLKSGLRPGDTVTLLMPNIPEYPVTIFGAMEAGIVVTGINPIYSPAMPRASPPQTGRMKRSVLASADSYKLWLLARVRHYHKHRKRVRTGHEPLPGRIRFGYSMGHVLNDLCASMWFTYALLFYTAVIGVSHTVAGVIMIIGQLADASATPVVGFLSDRGSNQHSTNRFFGKRKSWYFGGTVVVLITKPFMFSPCFPCRDSNDWIKLVYFSFFIVLFQFGWAAVQTIHLAMAADLTFQDSERTFLLSLRNTLTAVCNCATYVGQWVNYALSGQENAHLNEKNIVSFQIVVFAIIAVGAVTSLLFLVLVPEGNATGRTLSVESDASAASTGSSFAPVKTILMHWKLHYIGFIYLNTRIFVVAVQALLTLYLHEALDAHAYETASVPLVLNVFCFLMSLATSLLLEMFGRKATFSFGTVFGLGAIAWTFFGRGDVYNHQLIYIVAALYGCACAILQVTALALIAEYIGEDVNHGALIYGYMSFLDKVSTGVTLALILHFRVESYKDYFTYAVTGCCLISSLSANLAIMFLKFPAMSLEGSSHEVSKFPPLRDRKESDTLQKSTAISAKSPPPDMT